MLVERLVDKRHEAVHDKDSERHALRIRAEVAYHHHYQTYADAEDNASESARRRSYVIGGHKAGAQDDASRHKVEFDSGEVLGIDGVEDSGYESYGKQDTQGNPWLNHLPYKQIDKSEQQSERGDFTGRTSDVTKEHLHIHMVCSQYLIYSEARFEALLDY